MAESIFLLKADVALSTLFESRNSLQSKSSKKASLKFLKDLVSDLV